MGKRKFVRGDKFTVGGKYAGLHSYNNAVGKVCIYREPHNKKLDTHFVDEEYTGLWYVHADDLIPVNYKSNDEAASFLLRRDDDG